MNYARVAVVILILILFARLNWWVLPDLAIVHFAKDECAHPGEWLSSRPS